MAEVTKKNDTTVKTPRALGAYVTLKAPKPGPNGGDAAFSICLLWDKTVDLTTIKDAIKAAAVSKWGDKAIEMLKAGRLKNPLRDGDVKAEDNSDPMYKGKVFLNAKNTNRPGLVDTSRNPVDPGEVYSGCTFHAALRFFPFDKNGNKGVGCSLQNLMLVSKGKRMDGRKSADAEFEDFTPDVQPGDENGGVDDLLI